MRRRRLRQEQLGTAAGVTAGMAACAACCAAPLSAAFVSLGLGSAVGAWLLPGLWALAGLLGLAYVGLIVVRRVQTRRAPAPLAGPVDVAPTSTCPSPSTDRRVPAA